WERDSPENAFLFVFAFRSGIPHQLELYFRCFLSSGLSFEVWFFLKPRTEETSNQNGRKRISFRVEGLRSLIEPHSLNSDTVFSSFELGLQVAEILSCFQLGILLGNDHQTRQGGR